MGVDARMMVGTSQKVSDEELAVLRYDVAEAFRHGFFMSSYNEDVPLGQTRDWAIERAAPEDFGSECFPKGKHYLKVNLSGRYYGIGYERGDLPTILAVGAWLETRLPGCQVYYGGDASDDLEPLDVGLRSRLWEHFCKVGSKPYRQGWGQPAKTPDCCGQPMTVNGGGGSLVFAYCAACGRAAQGYANGEGWKLRERNV